MTTQAQPHPAGDIAETAIQEPSMPGPATTTGSTIATDVIPRPETPNAADTEARPCRGAALGRTALRTPQAQPDIATSQRMTWLGMVALMRGDLARTVHECTHGARVSRFRYFGHMIVPSAFCAVIFRTSQFAHAKGWWRLAAAICLLNQRLCGVLLHPASRIGPGVYIPHPMAVTFCGTAGANLAIYPGGYVSPNRFPGWRAVLKSDWPRLGDSVSIGTYSAILGDVTVGNDALINVQVVLRSDLPDGMSVLVRPNWRLQRKSRAPVPEPVDDATPLEP